MLALALDTATPWGRFALVDGNDLLVYRPLNVMGSYADALLPVIEEMLAETGRKKEDIKSVGVTIGPGSFTGLRIGVATAKGLAWALGSTLVGVTSLAAMAAALLDDHPETELAIPVLDARRGEVFSGIFERADGWVRPIVAETSITADAWWKVITAEVPVPDSPAYGGDGTPILLGSGEDLRPEILGLGQPHLRPWSSAHPSTAKALALAMGRQATGLVESHPFSLIPEYMRVSDAEVKRNIDLTPRIPSSDVSHHRGELKKP